MTDMTRTQGRTHDALTEIKRAALAAIRAGATVTVATRAYGDDARIRAIELRIDHGTLWALAHGSGQWLEVRGIDWKYAA